MKEMLEKALDKLEKISERLSSVDVTLSKQEENLKEHMRRTELLEKSYEALRFDVESDLEPIKTHVNQVKGVMKFLGILLPILATIGGIIYNVI